MSIREKAYNQKHKGFYKKPTSLIHYSEESYYIEKDGFDTQERWDHISRILPNRPVGPFFWSNYDDELGYSCPGANKLKVSISDLDTSKLFAFPNQLSCEADYVKHDSLDDELLKELKECKGVPYDEYEGTFAAEWIYTDSIPAVLVKKIY